MTTRKIVALLLALLYTAQCQESTDAASAFDLAASSRPLPTDQAVLDLFANPSQSPSESPFLFSNDTGAASSDVIEYGLSPDATSRLSYTGLGTVAFAQEPIPSSGAVSLGCGFGYIGSNFTSALVGVGAEFYQQGFSCGRCVLLQCDDSSCAQPGLQVVAQIVDQCGECFDADLNIGYPLFEKISGRSPAGNPTLSLSWQFVECSPYINDTIKMLVKPRGNAYYQAFNFANSRQVITAVQVNGQLLRHDSDHFWSWNPSSGPINPRGPFDFALLGANRQVLRVRLPQLRSSDLGIQFAMPEIAPAVEEENEAAVEAAIAEAAAAAPQPEEDPEPVAAASSATDGEEGAAVIDNEP